MPEPTATGLPGPLPEGAVLVHIGPPKTGTTSLQGALHRQRDVLRGHGVCYPGTTQRHRRQGDALLERLGPGGEVEPMSAWTDLVAEVAAVPDLRVCVSTESFARARPEHIERIVADLGRDRVHMVVAARRLDRLLPSAWQQRVKGVGEALPYGKWLSEVLDEERDNASARTFWGTTCSRGRCVSGRSSCRRTGSRSWWATSRTATSSSGSSRPCSRCPRVSSPGPAVVRAATPP